MCITSHLESEYEQVRKDLTKKDDIYFSQFIEVSCALYRSWSKSLSITEYQVLGFLVGRTLSFKKKAETIAFRHFIEGVQHEGATICSGCGLKEKAIRAAIKGLAGKGYVEIHTFNDGNIEKLWRIYEVKVDKILEDNEMNMVTGAPKSRKNRGINPLLSGSTPPSSEEGPISRRLERRRNDSTSVESRQAALPTPKKGRKVPVAINCTAQELTVLIANRAKETQTKRISRAASLSTSRWTTQELQALLDKAKDRAVEEGFTANRIVVVAKALPLLHKRMLEAQVADPIDFFLWAYKNWSTVASANKRSAARRQRDEQKAVSAMSLAPNFNDLSYRFPYLLAFYNERQYIATEARKFVEEQRAKSEKLGRQYAEALVARKQLVRQQDMQREEEIRQQDQTVNRRLRTRPRIDLEDEDLPEYKEPVWGGR